MKAPGWVNMMILFFVIGLAVGLAIYFIPYMMRHYGHHNLPKIISETGGASAAAAASAYAPKIVNTAWT